MSKKLLATPQIPQTIDELTPEWLTATLRASGVLEDARVVSRETEILGEGEGFVGLIVRLLLAFDRPAPNAPSSLIAKLPIRIAKNRQAGEALGAYEREIYFYTQLTERVPIRKPTCYYAAMDPNPAAGREREYLDFLGRLPCWLVRVLIPIGMWFAGRSKRRYLLLLEDLAPMRIGNQLLGCSPGVAEAALRQLATVHAQWWQHEDLDRVTWLLPANAFPRYLEVLYHKGFRGFMNGFGADLSPRFVEFAASLSDTGPQLPHRLGEAPFTLLHGDYRLDNLFLEGDGADTTVTAIDWQNVCQGPAAFDVAYFITGNLTPEAAAASSGELLGIYHEALEANGVTSYDYQSLVEDYEVATRYIAYRLVAGVDMLDFSNARGTALIQAWLARVDAQLS